MNPELQKQLFEKYPDLFNFDKVDPAAMMPFNMFGIECGSGWYDLLDTMFTIIQNYQKYNKNEGYQNIEITQIKEKFGTLRFYYSGGDDYVEGIVAMTSKLTETVCEECGKQGKMYDDGWITVRCEDHKP